MINPLVVRRLSVALLGTAVMAWACGENAAPVTVASVDVTSPIGSLLDVGGGTQLAAVGKNAQGAQVSGVSFTWTSSNTSVASVNATGLIQALAVGTATIRADAGSASGSLALRVVDADLPGINTLVIDSYLAALVAAASSTVKTRLQAATAQCTAGVQQGDLEKIQACVAAVRTEGTNATDPTDRALLAVLSLFTDQIERLLHA